MKNSRRFLTLAALLLVAVMLFAIPAYACTGVYVGREVSESGNAIIARTRDSNRLETMTFRKVTPAENKAGRVYKEINGFETPLPTQTYRYCSGPKMTGVGLGTFGASCVNEKGLAVTATVTAFVNEAAKAGDPYVETGISEACIGDLVAQCCATAPEAVDLIERLMAENGNAESNIIMVADQQEAWYIETYTGHQWCAVRMPEDKMATFGNEFMLNLTEQELAGENVRHSEGLISCPREKGFAVLKEDGSFDLYETYSGTGIMRDYCNMRTWYGHQVFAPSRKEAYGTQTVYDLFFAPDAKVSLADVMEFTRSRYEGTEFCPDENGRNDMRVVGTETQYSCDVTEIHQELPTELSAVMWACLDSAEHSVYLPFSGILTETAPSWAKDMKDLVFDDPASAAVSFRQLCALSVTGRQSYGKGVRAYWKTVEEHLMATYPQVLEKAAGLYAGDPEAAAKYLTDYSDSIQLAAKDDADHLRNEVLHYLALHQRTFDVQLDMQTGEMTPYEHPQFVSELEPTVADRYDGEYTSAAPAQTESGSFNVLTVIFLVLSVLLAAALVILLLAKKRKKD